MIHNTNEESVCGWLNDNVFTENKLKLTKDNKFKSWDVFNENLVGELNHRHMPYDRYCNVGYILEKFKFLKLVEESKKYDKEKTILYINSFDDLMGTIAIWDLSKLIKQNHNFNWHLKSMKKTTYFSDNFQVDKMITLLNDIVVTTKFKRKEMLQ